MKKIVLAALAAMLAFGVMACSPATPSPSASATASGAPSASGDVSTKPSDPGTSSDPVTSPEASVQPSEPVSSTDPSADQSLTKVMDAKKLVLGLDDSFPPMGYSDETGDIVGFDIDLAKEVCSRMGIELVVQPIDWTTKELELNSGKIDCIWNGMSINPEREEDMTLSTPYMNNTMAIVVRSDSDIKSKADLAGKIVGVQAGSSAVDAIDKEPEVKKTFELLDMANNVLAITELKGKSIDAVVADSCVIDFHISKDMNSFKYIEDDFGKEQYAIGFRKGDMALKEKIDAVLKEMKADGTCAKISEQWFGKDVTTL